jgi:hypothetical protein
VLNESVRLRPRRVKQSDDALKAYARSDGACWHSEYPQFPSNHTRRRDNGFSNIRKSRVGSTLLPSRCPSLVSFRITIATIIWTEPVKYWRKACLLACLDHTVLLQIMATSLILYSTIVLADDPRWKRRPEASSTLNRTKKRLLLSIYFKCPTLGIRYE